MNICEGGKERSQKKFLKQRRVKLDEKKLHVETEIYTTHFLCAVNCAPSVFFVNIAANDKYVWHDKVIAQ